MSFPEFPDHQRDVGAHFFLAFPGRSNVALDSVVIPKDDFKAFFLADFVESLNPAPVIDINNDDALDIINCDVIGFAKI
jgi:hypothetical protein